MRRFFLLTDLSGANAYSIPQADYREDFSFDYTTAFERALIGDGLLDLHGDSVSPKGGGKVALRFTLHTDRPQDIQGEVDRLLAAVEGTRNSGLRRLWRASPILTDRRFTWVRPTRRPDMIKETLNVRHLEVSLEFMALFPKFFEPLSAKWLADHGYQSELLSTTTVGEPVGPDLWFAKYANITSSPFKFTITNTGDLNSQHIIIRLRSLSGAGYTDPSITNTTLGYTVSTTRDAISTSSVLSINASPGMGRARYSTDGGVTWTDDTAALSLGSAAQPVIMELAPGDNVFSITCGGVPSYDLLVWWLNAYRD